MSRRDLIDATVNAKIVLANLWMCHFILWIFGDMFTLMQEMGESTDDVVIQFVAPTTAIVLTLVVVFNLVGRPSLVRMVDMVLAVVYLLLNIGFFADATEGWEYYLGSLCVLFNVLIFWRAFTWPTEATPAN